MSVLGVLGRRLASGVVVLLGLSILIFLLVRLVPGDPARIALGPMASAEQVESLRNQMRLNEPLPEQYFYFMQGVLQGDFGISLITRRPVTRDLVEFLPATLELVLFSGIIMVVFGLTLGVIAAAFKDRYPDHIVRVTALLGVVTPSFVWAVMLMLILGYWLGWLPLSGRLADPLTAPPTVTGFITIDALLAGRPDKFIEALRHLLLPAIALSLAGLGQAARLTRANMIETYQRPYIEMMRAFGVSEFRIATRYAFRPAFIPTLTVLGLDIAALFGFAFLVEIVFIWPGVARYGVQAMMQNDLNAITAVVMIIGFMFVVVNIIIDLIAAYLNPRIRLAEAR